MQWLLVGSGAALGAMLRYAMTLLWQRPDQLIPFGTLIANILGCFLMGIAMGCLHKLPMEMRLLLMTGFLGGLTTFSTFSAEMFRQLQAGQWLGTCLILSAHVLGSLLATIAGFALAHSLNH